MAKTKKILWGRVFGFFGILLMVFVVVLFSTNNVPSTTLIRSIISPRAAAAPKPINVLEIRYIPYNQVEQRAKINALSSGLVAALSEASKFRGYKTPSALPYSQIVIKRTIERDVNAPNTPGAHELWYDSLNTILTGSGENLCDYIVNNKIDQVWGWFDVAGDTTGGYDQEFSRFYSNALLPQDAYRDMCGGRRSFIFLGLDQNREVGEALHSFGHSMESLMQKVEGTDLFWNKWVGITGAEGGIAHTCGDVHFPPNGTSDYDYTRTTNVTTSCENWKPDGTGTMTSINCGRWGCNEEGYMKWWLQNAPNENNGFTYQGRAIPNWWDLLSDTDNAIGQAAYQGQYMTTQFLDASRPPNFDFSSKKWQDSGLSMTFSHPTAGTNRLMLISASYISQGYAATDSTARMEQIQNITVGGTTLTAANNRVNRTINGQYTTELWYMIAPPVGTNAVTVNFTNTFVNNQNVAITTFTGVNQTTPFASNTGSQATGGNSTPTITIPSTTSQMLFGVVSMYTGTNTLTVSGNTRGIAGTTTMNVIGKSAVAVGGPTASLSWTGTNSWPWSITGVAINLLATSTPTPTPAPVATSFTLTGPSSGNKGVASANFTVTPVGGPYTGTITITPSGVGATGLTAKVLTFSASQTAQTFTITPTVAGAITLTPSNNKAITNPAALTYTSIVPATPSPSPVATVPVRPVVDIKANKLDRVAVAGIAGRTRFTNITLTWTTSGATSCVGLGGWSGAKALNGTYVVPTAVSTYTYYALQCKNAAGVTWYDVVYVTFPITNGFAITREGKLFINGFDDTITPAGSGIFGAGVQQRLYVAKNSSPKLTWYLLNETCTPSWTSVLPAMPATVPAVTTSKTYSLSCLENVRSTTNTYSSTVNVY